MLIALLLGLRAVGCALALVALAAALLGRVALRLAGLESARRLDDWLLAAGVGLGLLSYVPFALSAASILTPAGVRIALAILLALGIVGALRSDKRTLDCEPPAGAAASSSPLPAWVLAVGIVASVFVALTFVQCLTPMVDPDGQAYHVATPKRWIELRRIAYFPTHLHTQWPMGTEMLYLLLYPLAGSDADKPLIGILTVLTAGAVFALGRSLASPPVGVIAASLFVIRAGVPSINTTSVEMPLAFFTALSALALYHAQAAGSESSRRRRILLAAALAGFACCTKLNGLLIAGMLTIAVIGLPRRPAVRPLGRAPEAMIFFAVALMCAAPWYIRTWLNTGNPVYPFAFRWLDGRDWNAHAAAVLADYFRTFDLPGDTLAARNAYVLRHLAKLAALTAVGVALPAPRWVRAFTLMAGIFALAQTSQSDIARFMLPGVSFGALAIGWWMAALFRRIPAAGWVAAAALAWYALPAAIGGPRTALPVILGRQPRGAFVRHYVNNYDAFLWANRQLPPDARILYGPDTRTYYLERAVYWSSSVFQQTIRYDSPAAFAESLRRARIGYLILNYPLFDDGAVRYETDVGWRMNERRRLEEAAARSEKLFEADSVAVYRLRADLSGDR